MRLPVATENLVAAQRWRLLGRLAWARLAAEVNPPPEKLTAPRIRHWQMLVLATTICILARLMDVVPGARVALHGFHSAPLPQLCLSRSWFGVECPACGLTRSFIYLAHGQFAASLAIHRLGWLIALAVLAQFPYRLICLYRKNFVRPPTYWPRMFGWFLIASLIVNWIAGLTMSHRSWDRSVQLDLPRTNGP